MVDKRGFFGNARKPLRGPSGYLSCITISPSTTDCKSAQFLSKRDVDGDTDLDLITTGYTFNPWGPGTVSLLRNLRIQD